jgi:hypothetical protein
MARTFSQDGGKLTLQKDSLLAAWRLSEEGKTQIEVAWLCLKRCKVTMFYRLSTTHRIVFHTFNILIIKSVKYYSVGGGRSIKHLL